MGRHTKLISSGPSHLARVLQNLNASPRLTLFNLKSIRLSLAFQNDHFGARHFVKEDLPRIRYANPDLEIYVEKVRKTAEEVWKPEMEIKFSDGQQYTLDMHEKWSTTILKELMEVAGGDPWRQWKVKAASAGLPLVIGEDNERHITKRPIPTSLPSLKAFRMTKKTSAAETVEEPHSRPQTEPEADRPDVSIPPLSPKSSAGARVLSF